MRKILDASQFELVIESYKILSFWAVHPVAILLPFIEFFTGCALILGIYPRAAALIITLLLVVFVVVLAVNLYREIAFDCGCFSSGDKRSGFSAVLLICRDMVFFVCTTFVLLFSGKRKWCLLPGTSG